MSDIVIIQKTLPNYREGFFDHLSERIDFKLITSEKNTGKILASKNMKSKKYMHISANWKFLNYVIFPFLFFTLIKIRPEIIITEGGQNTFNNIFVWLYCKLFNCEYIIWDLGKGYKKIKQSFSRKLYNKLYNYILESSKSVYTYHDAGKEYFKSQGFMKNIVPLKNTVDTREVLYALDNYNEQEQYVINNKFNKCKYYMLYVGAIHRKKSLEDFKLIMDMLPAEYGLIIVGSGNEKYVNKLKHLLNNERIYFEGFKNMEQLQYYYNHTDFFILPGRGGLAINQAMAFGLPVICTGADGIEKELVKGNETGYIYDSIEEAVNYILSKNKDNWAGMGKNAQELIFNDYTIEKMADRFIVGLEDT